MTNPADREWTIDNSDGDDHVSVYPTDGEPVSEQDIRFVANAVKMACAGHRAFVEATSPQGAVGPAFREAQGLSG